MLERRAFLGAAIGAALLPTAAIAKQPDSAALRLNALGPENEALAKRAGRWDVTQTVWGSPGAAPISTTGLVAERRMIGSMFFQEILGPASDVSAKTVDRIDYLTFNRVEGRWEYVSMDMRSPVGLMTAQSLTRGREDRIDLTFQPFAFVGTGSAVTGQTLRMEQVISHQGPDRDMKEQYFIMADGNGTRWLAIRYVYVRQA